jgi:hypothetical protein
MLRCPFDLVIRLCGVPRVRRVGERALERSAVRLIPAHGSQLRQTTYPVFPKIRLTREHQLAGSSSRSASIESASCGVLSRRHRAMRGKRTAMPDLSRGDGSIAARCDATVPVRPRHPAMRCSTRPEGWGARVGAERRVAYSGAWQSTQADNVPGFPQNPTYTRASVGGK